jgi:hypothetical protein
MEKFNDKQIGRIKLFLNLIDKNIEDSLKMNPTDMEIATLFDIRETLLNSIQILVDRQRTIQTWKNYREKIPY